MRAQAIIRALGLRCTPSAVHFVVLEKTDGTTSLVANDKLVAPKSASLPIQCRYVADGISDITQQFGVDAIGIKLTEPFGISRRGLGQSELTRLYFEGCIQAEMARSGRSCLSAVSNQVKAALKSRPIKGYMERNEFRGLDGFSALNKEQQEAAIVAQAALEQRERQG